MRAPGSAARSTAFAWAWACLRRRHCAAGAREGGKEGEELAVAAVRLVVADPTPLPNPIRRLVSKTAEWLGYQRYQSMPVPGIRIPV